MKDERVGGWLHREVYKLQIKFLIFGHAYFLSEGHAHFCNSDVHFVQRTLKMAQGLLKLCCYLHYSCLLYTSPSPRDATLSRMPSSA